MLKTAADPDGNLHEGAEYDLDDAEAKALIKSGAAVGVASSSAETAESPDAKKDQGAKSSDAETAESATTKATGKGKGGK